MVDRRAAERLRAGHLWVYASDVSRCHSARRRKIRLRCCRWPTIAASFSARRSTARRRRLRCAWSRAKLSIKPHGSKLLESRLRAAIARRKPLLDAANDACRLCFSEADELPGIIVDKYGELVILQFLTKGLLAAGVRETCVRVLREELSPRQFSSAPIRASASWRACPRPVPIRCGSPIPRIRRDHAVPSQRPRLSLRRQRRPENRRISRSAHQLRCRAASGRAGSARRKVRAARWMSAATRAALLCIWPRSAARSRASTFRAPHSKWPSEISKPIAPHITAEVDWIEADAFEILRDWSQAGESSMPSFSIRRPSPKPSAPWKALCAATRN